MQFRHLCRHLGGVIGSKIKRNQYRTTERNGGRKSSGKKTQGGEEGRRVFSESFQENPAEEDPILNRQFCFPSISPVAELARQYWSIENGTHYPLDVSAGEDRCRVRHPVAATVLGILRRAVQGEARAWIRRQPRARDRTCPTFLAKMSRRLGDVIRLITCPA